jgi:hypothetical protein
MAGARILYPQFRDEQADSRYPFADSASLVSTEQKLDIGRDTFFDATIYTIGGSRQAYISSIFVSQQQVDIRVGDVANKDRATASFNPRSPPESGVLDLFDEFGRPAGRLLSVPLALARFSGWPAATHTFSVAAAEFVSTVVIPAREPGVRALKTLDGPIMTGDVWLVGGRGVVVRKEDDTTIRIDIIGEPLFSRYICDEFNRFEPKTFLQTLTIDGVTCGPDEYGNFIVTATGHGANDTVLRVYPQDGNIKIDTVGRKVV